MNTHYEIPKSIRSDSNPHPTPTRLAFAGKMWCGKSTAARFFCDRYEELHNFRPVVLSFADRLKKGTEAIFKLPYDITRSQEGKASALKIKGLEHYTVRQILQLVGQALREHIDQDIWIKLLLDEVKYFEEYGPNRAPILVDDVRYPNEAKTLHENGFTIIGIVRNTDSTDTHPSEQGIANLYTDYIIDNNSPLNDLDAYYHKLMEIPEYSRDLSL